MPVRRELIFMLLCLAPLAGCAVTRSPSATVESVRLVDASAEGARYLVTVRLTNPNDFELPLHGADLNLRVREVGVYDFDAVPNRAIPANGEQTVTLAAAMPTARGEAATGKFSVSGQLSYQPPGEIPALSTDAGFPRPRVRFSSAGDVQVDLSEFAVAP